MNFNVLRYVVTVAEERNFTRAAHQLHISQPTLSQSILALESQLSTTLFDRKTNPVSLTYAGKLFVEWAQDILLSESQINRRLSAYSEAGHKSKLYIGISPHRSVFMLPDIVEQMNHKFPDCSLTIVESPSPELYESMDKRALDLMIHDTPQDNIRYTSILINQERLMLAVPSSYGAVGVPSKKPGGYPSIRLSKMKDKPFITLLPHSYIGHSIRSLCEQEEFSPICDIECGRVETAHVLVSRGLGITLLPEFFVTYNPPQPNVDYFYISRPLVSRDLSIIYRNESCLTDPALHFIELFKDAFGKKEDR